MNKYVVMAWAMSSGFSFCCVIQEAEAGKARMAVFSTLFGFLQAWLAWQQLRPFTIPDKPKSP